MDVLVTVMLVVAIALVFDFTNGFHDTANAMATSVATGALKPRVAVTISAVLNLVGAFLSTEVAKTISGGIINEGDGGVAITPVMIFAGLVGAVLWNVATWYLGLPSSSTHALFGGLIGAAIVGAGFDAVNFGAVVSKVLLPALISPLVAGAIALLATYLAYKITKNASIRGSEAGFRHGQTISASLVSLAHGTNDAQKTMGVITLTFIAAGYQQSGTGPQFWVIGACGLAIALGTYLGGWRIIRTVGKRITDITSPQGFAAETSSAATILVSSHLGFALSTTQVTSGSIVGAGLGKKLASVHWNVVGKIAIAWAFTLPAAAIVGGLAAWAASQSTAGLIIVAVLAVAGGLTFYVLSRRHPVTHENVNEDSSAAGDADPAAPTEKAGASA
ncbi:anion permease [Okibacterium fritillariae]|uniref:Phosphate transporter n=1 Tax=Okibacterium fritillariae TaxID=123320 RepID=A0A1T5KUJ9_9MICO|nr:inorganic phosphate transporter [Okibacterium fritillariae]SKC67464.1 inorganic phosphate transporter, PiT family [Okibacterium fritillariae]